jgi:hypothetical protein
MKRALTCIAILGLIVLASCSGDSPSPPPVPTPAGTTWAISSLTVSSATAYVGSSVTITATVTKNGSAAPDGTTVEFSVGGVPLANVATSGGRAAAGFTTTAAGSYTFVARVVGIERSVSVTFTNPDTTDTLLIYNVNPIEGAIAGGEQVTFTGNGIRTPVEVSFTVGGTTFPARVLNVVPSNSPGMITVETPRITVADATIDNLADVTVKVGVGTSQEQSQVLTDAFTFLHEVEYGTPVIYSVYPDQGSARGGDQVTILGANFTEALSGDSAVTRVTFGGEAAQVVGVSADGHQVTVITPPYGATPLQNNTSVTVVVETSGGNASKDDAFIYLADEPQPSIQGIAPAAGPIDGGTRVTIFGSGFQFPAQVFFTAGGVTKEASVISVNDDTSPADNDEIVCVTPDFSDSVLTTPFTADIRVLNVETGREGIKNGLFTYGDRLFVSGNDPAEGGEGTEVTIFGSGFVSPIQVDYLGFSSPLRVDPTSISGSQMVVRMPAPTDPRCTAVTGAFRVRLLESPNNPVEGGSFSYFGNTPTISSIVPSTVSEIADGVGVDPSSAVIMGKNFASSMRVTFDDVPLLSSAFDVASDTEIDVTQLPSPNDLGLAFDTVACVNGSGVAGRRQVPTPIDIMVTNTNANCSDTLTNGLTYEPQNTECVVDANIVLQPGAGSTLTLPATPAGSCSTFEQFTVRNTGGIDLEWSGTISGPFSYSGTGGDLNRSGTVTPGTSTTVEVYFCPTVDDNANQFGQIQFLSNDPNDNPVFLYLQGQEATGVLAVSGDLDFDEGTAGGECSAGRTVTLTNNGLDELNYTSALTGRFFFSSTGSGQGPLQGTIPGNSDTQLEVFFCPQVGASEELTGMMNLTSDDPNHQNATVNLTGKPTFPDMDVSWTGGSPDPFVFPTVAAGSCSAGVEEVFIANTAPDATLVLSYSVTLTGPFFLDSPGTSKNTSGTVGIGDSATITVYFCPSVDDNNIQTGVFRVDSNDFVPNDPIMTPFNINLQGQGAP